MSDQKYSDDDLRRVAGIKDEVFNDEIKAISEALSGLQEQVRNLPTRDEFNDLKSDMKVVKAAVTDTSHQVNDHERRLTKLEAKV